jgi:hypothetical protein
VVDPGVGGARRPLLFATEGYLFVGPDNGLFTYALMRERLKRVLVLAREKFFLARISPTFHGRDIFAPVAAHLSLGIKPEAFGPDAGPFVKLGLKEPEIKEDGLSGTILYVDSFGNLISNITQECIVRFVQGRPFSVRIGKQMIEGLQKGYWEGEKGKAIALIGSGGFLEIAVREGDAAKVLNAKRGDSVTVECRDDSGRQ